MTKKELEKMLIDLINNSEMIINRRHFRNLYFVNDIKKVRSDKLKKLFDPNFLINTNRKFSECDYFISLEYTRDYLFIKTNNEINNNLKLIFNDSYNDIVKFLKYFFSKIYNLNFSNRALSYDSYYYYYKNDIHLNENTFEHYEYENKSEDKTLVFSFVKYKFDICDYSYEKIVNLFKK